MASSDKAPILPDGQPRSYGSTPPPPLPQGPEGAYPAAPPYGGTMTSPGPYPPPAGAPGQMPPPGAAPPYQGQAAPGGAPPYQGQMAPGAAPPYQGQTAPGAAPSYQGQGAPPGGDPGKEMPHAMPSAPSLSDMDQVPGYNDIGFDGAMVPPPSYNEATREAPPERADVQGLAAVTDDQVREALYQFVSEHCCYGKGPAEKIKLHDMRSSSAFHYTLETFGEARSTKWAHEPFHGQPISVVGPPPGPWDLQVPTPTLFHNTKMDIEVPNTCSVKPCHKCHGRGYRWCTHCNGQGRRNCISCHGTGRDRNHYENGERRERTCMSCAGFGHQTCSFCNGCGQRQCNVCQGRANLKWFIQLTVTWTNHLDDHIVERTSLPDELIRGVTGQVAFQETQSRVWPVNHFPDAEINQASNSLVTVHGSKFNTERIIMQRHQVRIIPVTEVACTHDEKNMAFFVYGFENKVHFPDYPAKCCCGCSII